MTSGSSNVSHVPLRTCVICRGKKTKSELLRFAVISGEIIYDLYEKLPVKGIYVCKNKLCLDVLETKWLKRYLKKQKRNGKNQ